MVNKNGDVFPVDGKIPLEYSMAAKVVTFDCSICTRGSKLDHYCGHGIETTGRFEDGELKDFCVSVVAASKCSFCGNEMIPASSVKWKCDTEGCKAKGRSVYTGVHPVFEASKP